MPVICDQKYTKTNIDFESWPFELSDFQKYAIESITLGNNTIITAHTGSGKTLPAEFLLRFFKDQKKKVIYTTPIKSLSNEKFYDFQKKFPEISFGIITGDIRFYPDADVLIMTTECLLNTLYQMNMLKKGNLKNEQVNLLFEIDIENELGAVVFDEIHYINDDERGHVWEESIMMLPNNVQILGLSATMSNPEKLCSWIEEKKGRSVWLCPNKTRVVPLKHYHFITLPKSVLNKFPDNMKNLIEDNNFYENRIIVKEKMFDEFKYQKICKLMKFFKTNSIWVDKKFVLNRMIVFLKRNNLLPAICFVFSQKKCEEYAKIISENLFEEGSKIPSIIEDQCKKIMIKLPNYREYIELPEYKKIVKLLEKGIAYHHAGVTSVFREMIELLFSKGYIKLLFATETFSVGINMPTRTVVFTSMKKYSNKGFRWLYSSEYTQMSGRGGRRGIDKVGHVFHLTNFYVIQENNFPAAQTMREIMSGKPSSMESKFRINSNVILKLISVGNNNFENFIKNSMVSNSIQKQKKMYNEILSSLKKKKKAMFTMFDTIRTDIKDIKKYQEFEYQSRNLSRKKRTKVLREMNTLKQKSKTFSRDYDWYLTYENLDIEILKQKKNIKNLESYVQNEILQLLNMLITEGFVTKKKERNFRMITMYNQEEVDIVVYNLTEKGQIASNINELHPLAMSNILNSKILNTLSPLEIACVLSIFTNMKLSEENSVLNKNKLGISVKAINAIGKIEEEHHKFYDVQLAKNMEDIQAEYLYRIHYNLCDFMVDWWNATDANECYKEIEKMQYYDMSLGKIIKAILKLNNIVDELEKASLIQGNMELIEKLKEIPKNTLKFIATTQSLYL